MKRAELSTLSARMSSGRVPASVTFEIAGRCNLACLHCMRNLDGRQLPFGRVLSILEELRNAGVLELTFSGGEPFCRPDFFEILTAASEKGFAITVFTNGTLLGNDDFRTLAHLRIKEIQVTVFSHDPEVHDAITGAPGSHRTVVHTFESLRLAGIKVKAAVMVMTSNADSIEATLRWLEGLKIPFNYDFTLFESDDGSVPIELLRIGGDQICPLDEVVKARLGRPDRKGGCNMGLATACISASGDVFPCILFRQSAGNLAESSFAEIWGSDTMESFRITGARSSARCSSCPSRGVCFICPGITPAHGGWGPCPESAEQCRVTLGRSGLY